MRRYEDERILVRRQPLALRAVRRARPLGVPGRRSRSSCSATGVSRRSATCPYFITLGPHGFYWFSLEHEARRADGRCASLRGRRASGTSSSAAARCASSRPSCPATSPSADGSPRRPARITAATVVDPCPLAARARAGGPTPWPPLVIVQVELDSREPRALRAAARVRHRERGRRVDEVARRGGRGRTAGAGGEDGVLYDAVFEPAFTKIDGRAAGPTPNRRRGRRASCSASRPRPCVSSTSSWPRTTRPSRSRPSSPTAPSCSATRPSSSSSADSRRGSTRASRSAGS